jgi:phosphoglycolate phosphatase
MYQGVIFDLDGTLINSLKDLADSTNHALSVQGYPTHPDEEYRYFVGQGVLKLIEAVLPTQARNSESIAKTRALFDEYYDAHYLDKTKPYEGIDELVATLRIKGLKLAVVSNKPDEFAGKIVRSLFKNNEFNVVFGQREGIPRKPSPAGPLEACTIMGIDPKDCLYLGDLGVDMQTADAAGMYPVGVLWGFRDADELSKSGAKTLIKKPMELLEIL